MNKIKPIMQNDFKDCGICCMEWIIIYYGGYISLEKLREDTFTDKSGTNAYHLVNAFHKWGFDAMGLKESDITSTTLSFPLIAHCHLKNGLEHFIVVKKINKNSVYIMDPGIGDCKMTISEFNTIFTSHVILVKPRSNIIKMAKGLKISTLFYNILKEEKFLVFKIILTSMMITMITILSSFYLKIGSNLLNSNKDYLKYLMGIFLIVVLLKVIFSYIRDYYINHLNNKVDVIVYPEFLKHIFYLPFKSIKSRSTGEVITRINDLNNIKSLFSDIFVSGFLDTLMMLSSTIILYIISKKLFLILFIGMIIYMIFGIYISKIIYHKVSENIDLQTAFNSLITESITGLESLKNLNIIKEWLFKIEKTLAQFFFHNYEFNSSFNTLSLVKNLILEGCFFLINSYGLWSILNGNLKIVNLFTFDLILSYFTTPVLNIVEIIPKYNFIKASFNKISEFINIKEEEIKLSHKDLKGDIIFNNVSYSYNNYDYILNKVSFTIKKGSHVLLNGVSGSGKSTICKIIHKELIPNMGEVTIDGMNILDIDLGTIRQNILYISQKEELFTASIKENILMERSVSEDFFQDICKICELEDIVKKKSLRYESLIENEAQNLSGGERQRIILARGLIKNANIIILDEALSEVDKKLETKIIKNIRTYFKDKSIIYISHKNQKSNFEEVIEVKNELF